MPETSRPSYEEIELGVNRMRILYVDSHVTDYQPFLEHLKKEFDFIFCGSIVEAFHILDVNSVDLILFDMSSAYYTVVSEFFEKYSNKIPIIALSSSKDPKIAYSAARLDAVDFLYKDQQCFEQISSHIQRNQDEWKKKMEEVKNVALLRDSTCRKIIKDLINTELPITQRINSTLTTEIDLNEVINTNYGIQSKDIIASNPGILDSLLDMNLVTRANTEQTLSCPKCNSVNLFAHYYCKKCKHTRFVKKDKIKHLVCDYVVSNCTFEDDNTMVCTNCIQKIKRNSKDYEIMHHFECLHCLNPFVLPDISYSCNNCNLEHFDISEGKWTNLYQYNPNMKNLNRIRDTVWIFSDLEEYLKTQGFQVKYYDKFTNELLKNGPLELVAQKDNQILFFTFLNGDIQQDIKQILEVEKAAKNVSRDKILKSFAIFLEKPQDIMLRILEKCLVTPLVEHNSVDILQNIKAHI